MALKTFVPAIATNVSGTTVGLQAPGIFIFENGAVLTYPSDPTTPVQINGNATLSSTSTLTSIRASLAADISSQFNSQTGRTDGNTIQFIWLDDRGLL